MSTRLISMVNIALADLRLSNPDNGYTQVMRLRKCLCKPCNRTTDSLPTKATQGYETCPEIL
jgi:hypothetical protein